MAGEAETPGSRPRPPGEAAGVDPSMEDILASIRRILNEEETTPAPQEGPVAAAAGAAAPAAPAAATPAAPPPPPAPEDDALALSEDMLVSEPAPAAPEAPVALPVAAPATRATPAAAAPPPPEGGAEGLLAPAAAAAATASLGSLIRAVTAERSAAVTRGGPTIEDVVREEIRPLLKEWLDQHLPPLVERLVRAEIERVVGRALS